MKTPTTPRCPELPGHVLSRPTGSHHHARVAVNDQGAEVFFKPVVSYDDAQGHRHTYTLAEPEDLPDFSTDEERSRQCFIWGYANLEDALAVVRAVNDHWER